MNMAPGEQLVNAGDMQLKVERQRVVGVRRVIRAQSKAHILGVSKVK